MDQSAPDFSPDPKGGCNYCNDYLKGPSESSGITATHTTLDKDTLIKKLISKRSPTSRYDCIVGVSGGVDSSLVLIDAVESGLRPLAVHMDNGWNSELAQNNIFNLVTKLGVDLDTHVIDWNEYRSLLNAFLEADVLDVELLYDNAMIAVNYSMAKKYGLKYILGGENYRTEGFRMPPGWNWFKYDKANIKAIGRTYGVNKLRTFPAIGTLDLFKYQMLHRIRWVRYLDCLDYDYRKTLDRLVTEFNYKPYPYKHYESVFTRFYQGYILPTKFRIDKRRIHLSPLILNGDLKRDEALSKLQSIAYPSERELEIDIDYFLQKMQWKREDLDNYLSRPSKPHSSYKSELSLWNFSKKIYKSFIHLKNR
tara:strand:+ start:3010 stop:4107 length:1098 start_codon:yes stop_codon:yes gene_type:complete